MCLGPIEAFKALLVCKAGNLSKPYGFQDLYVIAHISNELHRCTMQNPVNADQVRSRASKSAGLWHPNSNAGVKTWAKKNLWTISFTESLPVTLWKIKLQGYQTKASHYWPQIKRRCYVRMQGSRPPEILQLILTLQITAPRRSQ